MAIGKDVLDQLLAGRDPDEVFACGSACNEDPVGGVIGVRSGPP